MSGVSDDSNDVSPTGESWEAAAEAALETVQVGPGESFVDAADLADVTMKNGLLRAVLEIHPSQGATLSKHTAAAEKALSTLPGVEKAQVILTAHAAAGRAARPPAGPNPDPPGAPTEAATRGSPTGPPNLRRANPKGARPATAPSLPPEASAPPGLKPLRKPAPRLGPIDGVDRILAIGSGKGGVGKSTVSANLAVALAAAGRRIGLLDADVYGPSQPRMLGVSERPTSDGATIEPLRNHGVTLMSIGLLTPDEKAVIWRGPMLMGALQQMLRQVRWGRLDALLVDLPPGTGDVQLTLSQRAEVTGAIVVSTPQDIALLDAKKAIDMFEKTRTPIVGVIENMSTFCCPECGHETQLFGNGGAKAEAERIGAPFLGDIPLDIDIRLSGDSGTPLAASKPDSPQGQRFREIAQKLIDAGAA
ncbi:MAG: Mrp/NBP35 family ATP-binding protein [Pseudomonadota bacterium]